MRNLGSRRTLRSVLRRAETRYAALPLLRGLLRDSGRHPGERRGGQEHRPPGLGERRGCGTHRARHAALAILLLAPGVAPAQAPPDLGTEEFGLSERELVQAVERVEELISRCMREEGFQYFAADYKTVRAGMTADKRMPGVSEREFVSRYGFGISTLYTGQPPQLSTRYSPARVGLGERNVQYFRG